MTTTLKKLCAVCATLLLLIACKKDKEDMDPAQEIPATNGRVLISCEGSFLGLNASISAYSSESHIVTNNVYQTVNGNDLGDVLQSLQSEGDKVCAVVNNSAKIAVMDKNSLIAETPITGLVSPRFMLPISSDKAYVSDLYSGGVTIVDLLTKAVSGQIILNAWTEEMVLDGNFAYITASDKDKIYVVNVNTDALVDSIQVTMGPTSISLDANNDLWVLCSGYLGAAEPALHHIDLNTTSILASMSLPSPYAYQMRMTMNPARTRVYVMNNTIFSMGISETVLPSVPAVPFPGNAYGLGISPANGDIYVADALDWSNPGKVFRYSSSGVVLDSMVVGIAPNGFLFQ